MVAPRSVGGGLDVHLGGQAVAVMVRPASVAGRRNAAAAAGGRQRILAPMPGRVVRVLVAAGDAVAARQGLLVVEAMKMENELRAGARRPGRVGGGHRGTVGRRGSGAGGRGVGVT